MANEPWKLVDSVYLGEDIRTREYFLKGDTVLTGEDLDRMFELIENQRIEISENRDELISTKVHLTSMTQDRDRLFRELSLLKTKK